ncbi:MAG: 1,4-dihydroxy-6-naphthoate synthase [Draconibacterium sp.]|nr:MAG: 1,4-dihydroxy-6-naphthoate synthase [Draconibacterium sp.]
MNLTLGFSTCPNDTYIFDAMVHQRIDTEGLSFKVKMADVEELNRDAFAGKIDITKISYHAYAHVASNYRLLTSGSALGHKNGPMVIAKSKINSSEWSKMTVAIPGKYTTANLLFGILFPKVKKVEVFLFSDIENAVTEGLVDAGVIIHENRFTYQQKGLKKIIDLGEAWEEQTATPIPLGGIAVNRSITTEMQQKINRVMKRSVEYAFAHPEASSGFVRKYAQEMEEEVMRKHIQLYVNDFTINLGELGENAVRTLYNRAVNCKMFNEIPNDIFVV